MKILLNRFHLNGHKLGFNSNHVQHDQQYHMNVLLNSFNLNGHTLGFNSQT